jgi:hypothetical protein
MGEQLVFDFEEKRSCPRDVVTVDSWYLQDRMRDGRLLRDVAGDGTWNVQSVPGMNIEDVVSPLLN